MGRGMMELVDITDLKSVAEMRRGSIPLTPTKGIIIDGLHKAQASLSSRFRMACLFW